MTELFFTDDEKKNPLVVIVHFRRTGRVCGNREQFGFIFMTLNGHEMVPMDVMRSSAGELQLELPPGLEDECWHPGRPPEMPRYVMPYALGVTKRMRMRMTHVALCRARQIERDEQRYRDDLED
jgi:hypothetical protein